MKVKILKEEGFDIALRGMAYSYKDRAVDPETWWPNQRERAVARSVKLAPMSGGHNKFIRQIGLWIDIEAPRCCGPSSTPTRWVRWRRVRARCTR